MASILIVDDDQDLTETVSDILQLLGHDFVVAGTGAMAMGSMKNRQFDLVLLDWQLPDMIGLEVCRHYRLNGGAGRVLMLTGMRDAASKESGRSAGADDFLLKPFSLDQLTERLNKLLCKLM